MDILWKYSSDVSLLDGIVSRDSSWLKLHQEPSHDIDKNYWTVDFGIYFVTNSMTSYSANGVALTVYLNDGLDNSKWGLNQNA